ncbi:MAG TPA: hypothetical protein VGH19_00705 [Verrucomicrobiae bacterium]
MDKNEAKLILQAYRPSGADASDPYFAEALKLVEQDAELKAWFEEQQAIDHAVSAKLRSNLVPADLRASILAGQKVIQAPIWWRRPATLIASVAAMLMLLAVPFLLQHRSSPSFADFKQDGMVFLDSLNKLDMSSKDHEAVREWLAVHGGHRQFSLPAKLGGKPSLGCRVFDWKGNKVTLICFNTTVGNKFEEVHLLVLDEKAVRNRPAEDKPEFEHSGEWDMASWRDNGLTYVLFGHTKNQLKLSEMF